MKKILFVLNKAPYSGAYSQEILDLAMTAAAFEQEVALALIDDAVFHLNKNQRPQEAGLRNISALFKALPMYDIERIYAETESLAERGLNHNDLASAVTPVARNQLSALFKQFDLVLSG